MAKDKWDKADIIAKFISSIVIASVGIWLTSTIQKSQIQFANSNAQNETKIKQANLTTQLINHLTSSDSNQRKIAILALKGNLEDDTYNNIVKVIAINDNSQSVRITAINQIGKSNEKSSFTTLTNIATNKNLKVAERQAAIQSTINISFSKNNNAKWAFIGAGEHAYEDAKVGGGVFTDYLTKQLSKYQNSTFDINTLYSSVKDMQYKKEQIPVLTNSNDFNISYSPDFFSKAIWFVINIDTFLTSPNLFFPSLDAKKFKQTIINNYKLSPGQIISLSNPTKPELLNKISEVSQRNPGKDIVFYYSGRSVFSNEGLTMTTLGKTKKVEEPLSVTEIKEKFNSENSITFLWDACTEGYGRLPSP